MRHDATTAPPAGSVVGARAASLVRPAVEPLPSASPIDAHLAPVQETRRRSGRAGTALVLGVIALCCCAIPVLGLILGIVATVKGASTAADVRRTGQAGRGKALIGEALGVLAIAGSIVFPLVFGLIP